MTKEQFIIIIDEWDCLFREDKNNENLQKEYINLLRRLFKRTPSGAHNGQSQTETYESLKMYIARRRIESGEFKALRFKMLI